MATPSRITTARNRFSRAGPRGVALALAPAAGAATVFVLHVSDLAFARGVALDAYWLAPALSTLLTGLILLMPPAGRGRPPVAAGARLAQQRLTERAALADALETLDELTPTQAAECMLALRAITNAKAEREAQNSPPPPAVADLHLVPDGARRGATGA